MNLFEDQGVTTTFHTLYGQSCLNSEDKWATMSLSQGQHTNMD